MGVAAERVRELVFHQLKPGDGFGKSPGIFHEEERAVVCLFSNVRDHVLSDPFNFRHETL